MGNKTNNRKGAGLCRGLKLPDHPERCGGIQIEDYGFDAPFTRVRLESSPKLGSAHDVNSHTRLLRGLADLHREKQIVHNSDHSQACQPF